MAPDNPVDRIYITNKSPAPVNAGAGGIEFLVIATVAPDTTAIMGTSYDYSEVTWQRGVSGVVPDVVTVQTGVGSAAPTDLKAKAILQTSIRLKW